MRTAPTIAKPVLLALGAALLVAAPAGALPVNTGGGGGTGLPPNPAPVARFTVSPNPALVSPVIVAQARVAQTRGAAVTQTRAAGVQTVAGSLAAIQTVAGPLSSGQIVRFDASASTDDGHIVDYAWDLDGNGTFETHGASPRVARRYFSAGTFTVRLRVKDDRGATGVASQSLRIHRRPRAAIQPRGTITVAPGQRFTLTAKDSWDDNGIARFDWDLDGNGTFEHTTGRDPEVNDTFATLGTSTVRVRVTDIYGATDTASVIVVVAVPPPPKPTFPRPDFGGTVLTVAR